MGHAAYHEKKVAMKRERGREGGRGTEGGREGEGKINERGMCLDVGTFLNGGVEGEVMEKTDNVGT